MTNDESRSLDRILFDGRLNAERRVYAVSTGWPRRLENAYADGWRDAERAVLDWLADQAKR